MCQAVICDACNSIIGGRHANRGHVDRMWGNFRVASLNVDIELTYKREADFCDACAGIINGRLAEAQAVLNKSAPEG